MPRKGEPTTQPRANGRFVTAERTTETTTTVTERLTIGHHHRAPAHGPTPIFDNLIANWPNQRLATLETARAATNDADRLDAFTRTIPPPDDVVAWTRAERAMRRYETAELREQFAESARNHPPSPPHYLPPVVPYPALDEDTLAQDFEPLPPLPDMMP